MMKTEQAVRRGVVVGVGVLLLGFIGCTTTLEREIAPALPGPDAAASSVSSGGLLGGLPAEPSAERASAPSALGEEGAPLEAELRVHEIVLTELDGRQALVVRLSRPPDRVQHFALSTPNRVAIDLEGPLPAVTPNRIHPVVDPRVAGVRVGVHEGALRIVTDFEGALPDYAVEQDERTVIALLGPSTGPASDQLIYRAPGVMAPAALADGAPEGSASGIALGTAPEAQADDPAADPTADTAGATALDTTSPTAASAADPIDYHPTADPAARPMEVALAEQGTATAPGAEAAVAEAHDPAEAARAPDQATYAPAPAPDQAKPVPEPPLAHEEDPVSDPPAFEKPTAYALAVQAGGKAKGKSPKVTTIEGGRVETVPPREPREYTGQRISLDFKDADIQNVLRILADVSNLNIITTEDVSGKLTMRLVDVPWDQALDAILKAKGLDMVRDGNIIRVSTVEQLKKERNAQREADEAQKQVEPLRVRYLKVNYAKADEKLVKKVKEVLTERGQATWDERTNTIVIRDIARGVTDAEDLIREFDTQTPQVLIEANIVEGTEELIRDLGIQWGYSYRAGPGTGNATGVNFPGLIGAGGVLAGGTNSKVLPGSIPFIADFPAANVAPGAGAAYDLLLGSLDGSNTLSARLTALENARKGKIISRPRVVTLNNVTAKIESLRIVRVRLPSTGTIVSTGAGGVAGGAQAATEQIRTGITLQVTPQVSSDGFIFLDIFAKSSTLLGSSSPDSIPDEASREAESHVLIRNGETFVLGGVFRNELDKSDRGIPYLRSIPVIGWAFKNNLNNDQRQELLVFITPTAVAGRGTEDLASLPSAESLWQNREHP